MHDLLSVRLTRERRIAQAIVGAARPALQPGLFDRRAERTHVADSRAAERIRRRDRRSTPGSRTKRNRLATRPARLLLVLVP